jgi:hypothetical protein
VRTALNNYWYMAKNAKNLHLRKAGKSLEDWAIMMMEEVKCKRQKVEDTLAKQSWSDKNKKHQVCSPSSSPLWATATSHARPFTQMLRKVGHLHLPHHLWLQPPLQYYGFKQVTQRLPPPLLTQAFSSSTTWPWDHFKAAAMHMGIRLLTASESNN